MPALRDLQRLRQQTIREREAAAATIASSAAQREISRQLRESVHDLLERAGALFDEIEELRRKHPRS